MSSSAIPGQSSGRSQAGWATSKDIPRRHLQLRAGTALCVVCLLSLVACGQAAPGASTHASATAPAVPESLYMVEGAGNGVGNDALEAVSLSNGQMRWSTTLAGMRHTNPVMAGDVVYVGGEAGQIKSGPAAVTAVRAQDGKQLWQTQITDFGSLYAGTPIPGDGAVYTSTATGIYALRASDGHILWHFEPGQHWLSPAPLAMGNGLLYVAVGAATPDAVATLYALRPRDGSVQWHYSPPDGTGEDQLALTMGPSTAYLSTSTNLYAIRTADGTLAWSAGVANRNPVVGSDAVYLISGTGYCTPAGAPLPQVSTVTARRASDGTVLWTSSLNGVAGLSVVTSDSAIYLDALTGTVSCPITKMGPLPFTPTADTLYALGASSGSVFWHATVNAPLAFTSIQPSNGVVFAAAAPTLPGMGTVYAFGTDGTSLWHRDLPSPGIWPIVSQGVVYVSGAVGDSPESYQPALYALHASDGTTLWTAQEAGNGASWPPAISGQ